MSIWENLGNVNSGNLGTVALCSPLQGYHPQALGPMKWR